MFKYFEFSKENAKVAHKKFPSSRPYFCQTSYFQILTQHVSGFKLYFTELIPDIRSHHITNEHILGILKHSSMQNNQKKMGTYWSRTRATAKCVHLKNFHFHEACLA